MSRRSTEAVRGSVKALPCFAGRPYIDPGALGPFEEPGRPVFAFDRVLGALERGFYRHLVRAIDLDAMFGLEQLLWTELQELELFTDDQVLDLANAILARALERVACDPLRSMREGKIGPDGQIVEVPEAPHGDCPFCRPAGRRGGSSARTGVQAGAPASEASMSVQPSAWRGDRHGAPGPRTGVP